MSVALKSLMTRELAAKSIFRSARISCTTFLVVVVVVFVVVVVVVAVVVIVFVVANNHLEDAIDNSGNPASC